MLRSTELCLCGLLILLLASCTTTSSKSRGSLSDAMDKARDDYPEEREVPDEDKPFWPEDDDAPPRRRDDDRGDWDDGDPLPYYGTEPALDEGWSLTARLGRTWADGPYFLTEGSLELLLGLEEDEVSLHGFAGLTTFQTRTDHSLHDSIKDQSGMVYAGGELRYYPFPDLPVLSPYGLARLGGFYYAWNFRNPLTAGDDVITGDMVGGMLLGAGLGLDLLRWGPLRVGGQVIPEAYLFGPETQEGFTNDYFLAQGSVKWSLEAGLAF